MAAPCHINRCHVRGVGVHKAHGVLRRLDVHLVLGDTDGRIGQFSQCRSPAGSHTALLQLDFIQAYGARAIPQEEFNLQALDEGVARVNRHLVFPPGLGAQLQGRFVRPLAAVRHGRHHEGGQGIARSPLQGGGAGLAGCHKRPGAGDGQGNRLGNLRRAARRPCQGDGAAAIPAAGRPVAVSPCRNPVPDAALKAAVEERVAAPQLPHLQAESVGLLLKGRPELCILHQGVGKSAL